MSERRMLGLLLLSVAVPMAVISWRIGLMSPHAPAEATARSSAARDTLLRGVADASQTLDQLAGRLDLIRRSRTYHLTGGQ